MIIPGNLRSYAAANMPEDNTSLVGGAIDLSTSVDFTDIGLVSRLQVVSSRPEDTFNVMISGRLMNGFITTETVTLSGTTPVLTSQVAWERLMKVMKSNSAFGDIAIEQLAATTTGTVVTGVNDHVVLTPDTPDLDYRGMVFRVTAGTGVGTIAKVLNYDSFIQDLTLDKMVVVDSTSVFRIGAGIIMPVAPHEILAVRRPFYNVIATTSNRVFYEKFFWRNDSAEVLQTATVLELMNPTGKIKFLVDPVIGGGPSSVNRLIAPFGSLPFGRSPQVIPTVDLGPHASIGVWLSFEVSAGQSPVRSSYLSGLTGQTV